MNLIRGFKCLNEVLTKTHNQIWLATQITLQSKLLSDDFKHLQYLHVILPIGAKLLL